MEKQIIDYLTQHPKVSMNELADGLNQAGAERFPDLVKVVSRLESKGTLRFTRDGLIALEHKTEGPDQTRITGVFRANKAGFGFLAVEGEEEDLFVGRTDVGHAIDGDTVEVVVKKPANRLKGTSAEVRVVDIVERALKTVVGKFVLDDEKPKYAGYITSKNRKIQQRIYIKKEPVVLDGTEIIKLDIVKYPSKKHDYFVGEVRDIIGHQNDVGIDVLEVLESMDIVSDFPEDVMAEANQVPDAPSEKDFMGRIDLRDEVTFTIDGKDAKDLDDAVHIKLLPNGNFELGVHIADVSYYVTEGSALDREAVSRGTSVYVTDRVVPMLPERLSNGICSLNPQVNRLTQSCIMEIDRQGRVVAHQIAPSIIKTTFRMTYSDVNSMLQGDQELLDQYAPIVDAVRYMASLHQILEDMRVRRGALNFDTQEAKILVDDKGKPVDIQVRQRGIAERMIESFMLAANETVAEHFARKNLPFIYRIHEEPKAEKLQKFIDYATIFGVPIHGTAQKVSQQALQDFMAKVEGKPGADVLAMMLLRSMQQARYSEHNHGHYGLAATYYTHFTSPIRRYPDLLVHRLIREYATVTPEKEEHFAHLIPEIAGSSSTMERRAIDAERAVEAMKKAEYMEAYVGQEFEGVVASVVKFGLFVELPNTIEGLVHITTFPEFYQYNERTMSLHGESTGKAFRVGQKIKIKLTRADKETGDIDFEYLASDFDVIEKKPERDRDRRRRPRDNRDNRGKGSDKSGRNGKPGGKKPFYKDQAKKRKR